MADMDLKCFLKENTVAVEDKEYIASDRFRGNDGQPVPWRLRVLDNREVDRMVKSCQKKEWLPKSKEYRYRTDNEQLAVEMVCASVVYPNLNSAELQESYGAVGAQELVRAMLTPGEYTDLVFAVNEVCGFQSDMDDKIKTAKN